MTSFEEYCPLCEGGLLASGGLLADGGPLAGGFFETEFDFNSCLMPNDISSLVKNCLADIPLGKFAQAASTAGSSPSASTAVRMSTNLTIVRRVPMPSSGLATPDAPF